MPAMNKLTAVAVANMTKPGRYADGNGLYLQVARGGTKSWLFRYMRGGKARQMGLGPGSHRAAGESPRQGDGVPARAAGGGRPA
jgi:hypothetical protein